MTSTEKARRQRPKKDGRISLSDVAKHADVSTATVSRVLNTPDKVAEKSRNLVNAAIDELGYIPDGAARALASSQSHTIGAVVPTIDNALFAVGIQSFQKRLKQSGYTLVVASHEYDLEEEFNEVKTLLRQGVDALLLVGTEHSPQLVALLKEKSIPQVNCWAYDPASEQPHIGFDNRKAANDIAQHLIELGHTRIAVISGKTHNNDRAIDRLAGFRQAIDRAGLTLPAQNILERSYSVKQGRNAMRQLLQSDNIPTAVLCGNDILAIGAIAECQSSGLRVPEQISITGFDDLDISSQLNPALTTIRVASQEMGTAAAEYLIARLRGQSTTKYTEIETQMIIRETTARPR